MVLNVVNLVLKQYWESMENDLEKCVGTLNQVNTVRFASA